VLQAQRHAENVGRIGLQDDGFALSVEFEALVIALRLYTSSSECEPGEKREEA
jgi:hypothetical protein